ncbi:hypothetical protein PRIPAC_74026 [Pristionchus pacificus]|uniref:THAP-type domain-containing protein n=1 Tax=Pristionchus pacificus TaxID=54126 RepID=A0A2A6CR01_PRIPA|nr:hypothetical protein PRIPAC_74026 [Pristionchus pacificus]|eukprot:PDM80559.1 hypothetical protein PRIPAC_35562 [Pristionchus pacificus]
MSETPGPSARVVKQATNRVLMGRSTSEKETNRVEVKEEPLDDNEKSPEKELHYTCSVDACRKSVPHNEVEYLPQDNVLEGIKMIIRCKTSIYDQNYLIQRYLEGHHLNNRPDYINVSWTRSIPFRACPRHFDRSKKLIYYLPLQVGQSWRNYHELILREGLFYMYGVDLKVDYFFDTKVAAKQFDFGCVIPGCLSNPLKLNPSTGLPLVKLFLVPADTGLRNEWLRTVREGHNKLLTFTPRLPVGSVVCEKHFVNGGKIVNGIMELPTRFHERIRHARTIQPPEGTKQKVYRIVDRSVKKTVAANHCLVRGCPINSNSMKIATKGKYVLYQVPDGYQGGKWIVALRAADPDLQIKYGVTLFVCERHFRLNPYVESDIPRYFLTPPQAAMSKAQTVQETLRKDDPCPCCNDVEICHSILRRFNAKMNTLMQHVNMLCVLEGVKEVIPRQFHDAEDDKELYGDPAKVAQLADIRAASMFVREAKGELAAVKGALNNMSAMPPRRSCALLSCCYSRNPRRTYRLVDTDTFEDDLLSGELLITQDRDTASVRRVLAKDKQVALCERHWKSHISNMEVEFDEDSDDVRKLKEALALPVDFQPKFKKRRTEELEDPTQGSSAVVKVEVHDDEEEDERLLSNNELLQRLLGGAIAGQVTGEIGDNGEVYEGGEEEEEMDNLDNVEPHEEEEDDGEEQEGPPELD